MAVVYHNVLYSRLIMTGQGDENSLHVVGGVVRRSHCWTSCLFSSFDSLALVDTAALSMSALA